MSSVLYYSKFCKYCKELITKISRTKTKDDMHFVCIDTREKHQDGTTHITEAVQKYVNPIINTVKDLLEQHGYKFDTFDTFKNDNITIDKILYQFYIPIEKKIIMLTSCS